MGKKISIVSSTITLTILIFLLLLNLNAKKAGTEIWDATWKSLIPEGLISDDSEIKAWFDNIFENSELTEENGNIIDIEKYKEMMKEFSNESGEEAGEYIDIIGNMSGEQHQYKIPGQEQILNVFKFLSGVKIKYVFMILILLVICSMVVTLNSYHKWIPSLAWAMALSGVGMIVVCELLKKYVFSYFQVEVTLNSLIDPAQYLIIGGVIIRIIYFALAAVLNINKKIDKEEKNEISEVPGQ